MVAPRSVAGSTLEGGTPRRRAQLSAENTPDGSAPRTNAHCALPPAPAQPEGRRRQGAKRRAEGATDGGTSSNRTGRALQGRRLRPRPTLRVWRGEAFAFRASIDRAPSVFLRGLSVCARPLPNGRARKKRLTTVKGVQWGCTV